MYIHSYIAVANNNIIILKLKRAQYEPDFHQPHTHTMALLRRMLAERGQES
jgi:hypothetical protein